MNNTNERTELIAGIRHELAEFAHNKTLETLLLDTIEMLEADAQLQKQVLILKAWLEAGASRITELEALSVTNILLDVVPGDGSGLEIFAKSTSDVVDLLTKMDEKIEDFESSKQAQQVAVPPRECYYESPTLRVCNKCGQRHDKAVFASQGVKS